MPEHVSESLGLFRDRVHPTGTPRGVDGWWEVNDASSATRAVDDMVQRMDETGWATLDSMMTRAGMLRRIESGDLGHMKRERFDVFFARAEALLLMDEGPSDALESRLGRASGGAIPMEARDAADEFNRWVRSNAHRAAAPGTQPPIER